MIKVQLAQEKSHFEHRRSNISYPGENVTHAQPSVAQEEDEIQNPNFELESSKCPGEDPEEDDRKPAAKRIKQEPVRIGLRKSRKRHPQQSPAQIRRTTKQYSESILLLEKTVKKTIM